MTHIVSIEINGKAPLVQGFDGELLKSIMPDTLDQWWAVDTIEGESFLLYQLLGEQEIDYAPNYPPGNFLEEIIQRGFTRAAWRESVHISSDTSSDWCRTELRGTKEQRRSLRLCEISAEIETLEEERVALLGGSNTLLSELGLSVRCQKALSNDGVTTITDVLRLGSEAALLRVPNFGRRYLHELRTVLQARGSWFH